MNGWQLISVSAVFLAFIIASEHKLPEDLVEMDEGLEDAPTDERAPFIIPYDEMVRLNHDYSQDKNYAPIQFNRNKIGVKVSQRASMTVFCITITGILVLWILAQFRVEY
jgi:hypothetical protein